MKAIKKLFFVAMIVLPLLAPTQSKAGGLDDLLGWLFGGDKDHPKDKGHNGDGSWDRDHGGDCGKGGSKGNSVPINGGMGLVVLLTAGLGLGAKVILDRNKVAVQNVQ
jgi:hypothetical protein